MTNVRQERDRNRKNDVYNQTSVLLSSHCMW